MSYGPIAIHTITMASAGTLTSECKLKRSFKNCYLVIPTMTSNTQIHLQGSDAEGGTFRRVYFPLANAASPSGNVFAINSAVTNAIVPIPNGLVSVKVETTATVDNGCTFKIICSD